jgi:PadR family transcriptional regulator PadR
MASPKLSHSAALILKAVSLGYRFGFEIMEVTGLPSGTVYPALRRLERDKLVDSDWEPESDALTRGRPTRRYYSVTATGNSVNLAATGRYPLLARLLPVKSS